MENKNVRKSYLINSSFVICLNTIIWHFISPSISELQRLEDHTKIEININELE